MVKISVIIPIYNCEQYIEQCVRSVLRQTLKDLEVICVDDGSTDQSVQVLRELMRTDERIILCQQKNQGPGIARNTGMKRAEGKYIAFLDADDFYWDQNGLEQLWKVCEAKKAAAGASLQWCVNGLVERLEDFEENVEEEKIIHYAEQQADYHFCCYLFLREMLIKKEIYFPAYLRFEDPPFLVRALYEAEHIAVADICLYYYRRPVAGKRFNEERTLDLLSGLMDNVLFAQKHNLKPLLYRTVHRLEYEYMGIILENILLDDLRIIEKLQQLNNVIRKIKEDTNYIIRPLRGLLLYVNQYDCKIIRKIKAYDEVILYGAGRYGQLFLEFLEERNCLEKVSTIVVTEQKNNKSELRGIKVKALKDLKKHKDSLVLVAAGENFQQEMEQILRKHGYRNYEMIRDEFLYLMTAQWNAE